MNNLIQSFQKQRDRIVTNGCVVMESDTYVGPDGEYRLKWYHSYKKANVKARLAEIDSVIAELSEP